MLSRSCSFAPTTVRAWMSMPRPSGYCGAMSLMCHNGKRSAKRRSTDANARSTLDTCDILLLSLLGFGELGLRRLAHVGHEFHGRSRRRHADIALHLLVECRAEVRAVERIDAGAFGNPLQRARITRLEDQLGVGHTKHREPVQDVPVLLDVGDVEVDRVTDLYALEIVGREVAADGDHLDVDALSVARDAALALRLGDPRIRVFRQLVILELLVLEHF